MPPATGATPPSPRPAQVRPTGAAEAVLGPGKDAPAEILRNGFSYLVRCALGALCVSLVAVPIVTAEARGFNRLALWFERDGNDLATADDPETYYDALYLDGYPRLEALLIQLSYLIAPWASVSAILLLLRELVPSGGPDPPSLRGPWLFVSFWLLMATFGIPAAGISVMLGSPVYAISSYTAIAWYVWRCHRRFEPATWHGLRGLLVCSLLTNGPLTSRILLSHVDPATSDAQRVFLRLAVYPLVVEVALFGCRHFARSSPDTPVAAFLLALAPATSTQVTGRVMLLAFESREMASLCLMLVTLEELLLRTTASWRDEIVYAIVFCWGPRRARAFVRAPRARRAAHVARSAEQVGELAGVVIAGAVAVAFRLGLERSAPATAELVSSTLLGVAVELAADGLPSLLLASVLAVAPRAQGRLRRALDSQRLRQAQFVDGVLGRYTRRFATITVLLMAGVCSMAVLLVVVPMAVLCPISEWNGWWHWVPCAARSSLA